MALFKKESGTCDGRGFNSAPDGFLRKFHTWITSGVAGWSIIDDHSADLTNPYIVITDNPGQVVNYYDPVTYKPPRYLKVGYITSEATYIRVWNYMWWNTATSIGHGLWNNYRLSTYDTAQFLYSFRGGAECMMLTSWTTAISQYILDEFEHLTGQLEAEDKISTITTLTGSGSNVVIDVADDTKFTAQNYYYIYDFSPVPPASPHVEYVKVIAVGSGTVTVETITSPFNSGSVIGAYPHRIYTSCNGYVWAQSWSGRPSRLPYYSASPGYVFYNQSPSMYIGGSCYIDVFSSALLKINPDDFGLFSAMRPLLVEAYRENDPNSLSGMNRVYGKAKNVFIARNRSYVSMQDGLTINGLDYIKVNTSDIMFTSASSSNVVLILNTESV